MFIQTLRPPVAGQEFRFSIAGAVGETRVQVTVDDRSILARRYNKMLCQAKAAIPADSAGGKLSVVAIDARGEAKKLEYEISASDPGPHSMLTVTRRRVPVATRRYALIR